MDTAPPAYKIKLMEDITLDGERAITVREEPIELCQLLTIGVHEGGKAPEQSRAVAGRHMAPGLVGLRCSLDRHVGLGEGDRRDLGDFLPSGGVDDGEGAHARILADANGPPSPRLGGP